MSNKFELQIDTFSGPFDLLLSLIHKKKLDISILSLSKVTDEFLQYVKSLDSKKYLDEIAGYIETASILYSLKIASLLPGIKNESPEDLELIEKRNLLFSRLIQYKAFKDVSVKFAELFQDSNSIFSSTVWETEKLSSSLGRTSELGKDGNNSTQFRPDYRVNLKTDKQQLAQIASNIIFSEKFLEPSITHLLENKVSIHEESHSLVTKLFRSADKVVNFSKFCSPKDEPIQIVAKFLAVLELFRINFVTLEQKKAYADIKIMLLDQVSKLSQDQINKELEDIGV
jgi:segregation and condensation protein A